MPGVAVSDGRTSAITGRVAILIALTFVGCGSLVPPSPSPSAVPSVAPSASAGASPTAASVPGVEVLAAGPLKGDIAYVLKRTSDGQSELHEVWLVALDGSRSAMVVRYSPSATGGVSIGAVSRDLSRSLSPDGTHLLVSAQLQGAQSLVDVNLIAGTATPLVSDTKFIDLEAAWQPGGKLVAASRAPTSDPLRRELWVGGSDGSGWRRVGDLSISTLYGFTPDGAAVCVATTEVTCISISTGQKTYTLQGQPAQGIALTWRSKQPAAAAALRDSTGGHLDVTDASATGRPLVRALATDPRWRPSTDEVLYRVDTSLLVAGLDGKVRTLASDKFVRRAVWSPSGSDAVFVASDAATTPIPPAPPPASSLRLMRADGTGERELLRVGGDLKTLGLAEVACVRY